MSGLPEEGRVNGLLHQSLCKLARQGPPARLLPRFLGTAAPRLAPPTKNFSRLAPLIFPKPGNPRLVQTGATGRKEDLSLY